MKKKILVLVVGYGNIGCSVVDGIKGQPDMELAGVLTRRPDDVLKQAPGLPVFHIDQTESLPVKPDVAILCGGSCSDLFDGGQGQRLIQLCHTVDSFDTHPRILEYADAMNSAAKEAGHVAIFSTGWDPGAFSMARVHNEAFMLGCKPYAFYGLSKEGGLSMGHTNAINILAGVANSKQYTHALEDSMKRVRSGENPDLAPGDMHWRECIVVLEEGADENAIRKQIIEMPNYFAPYRTEVEFVTQEELDSRYTGMPHDGIVIAVSEDGRSRIEYSNTWESNPDGTAGIMLAFARAAVRLGNQPAPGILNAITRLVNPLRQNKKGYTCGSFSPLDIPPAMLSIHSREILMTKYM